jgi:hypothetical protein
VGNKLRGKLVAVVANSNGASPGDGEDVAPTTPDCESIVSLVSLCVCISVCVCPFPFVQTLNPNSGHFLNTNLLPLNWHLVSDFQSPHVFLEIAEEKEEEEQKPWMLSQNSSLPMPPL